MFKFLGLLSNTSHRSLHLKFFFASSNVLYSNRITNISPE